MPEQPQPALIAIFGATGDLAHRKLTPALYQMALSNQLPKGTIVLGIGRDAMTDEDFRSQVRQSIKDFIGEDSREIGMWCDRCLFYFGIGKSREEVFRKLRECIERLEQTHAIAGNRVFYLALPPAAFEPTIESLGASGL